MTVREDIDDPSTVPDDFGHRIDLLTTEARELGLAVPGILRSFMTDPDLQSPRMCLASGVSLSNVSRCMRAPKSVAARPSRGMNAPCSDRRGRCPPLTP